MILLYLYYIFLSTTFNEQLMKYAYPQCLYGKILQTRRNFKSRRGILQFRLRLKYVLNRLLRRKNLQQGKQKLKRRLRKLRYRRRVREFDLHARF